MYVVPPPPSNTPFSHRIQAANLTLVLCVARNVVLWYYDIIQVLIMLIIIPFPLFFAQTIYGVRGLTAWVVIGIIWCFISAFSVVLYPLWESREALRQISRGIVKVRFWFCSRPLPSSTVLYPLNLLFAAGVRMAADVLLVGCLYEGKREVCGARRDFGCMMMKIIMMTRIDDFYGYKRCVF